MSDILTVVPPDWIEIKNAGQLITDSGYEPDYWMELLGNKEWSAFETLYDTLLPPNTSTDNAYILGDSIFVHTFSIAVV